MEIPKTELPIAQVHFRNKKNNERVPKSHIMKCEANF